VITIRILFIESDHRFIYGLPLGFRDAGHEVVISGSIDTCNLSLLIRKSKPDLIILMGWTSMHSDNNLTLINEVLSQHAIPYIYWATEDPTFTTLFSIPLVKQLTPCYIFTVSQETVKIYENLGYPSSFLPFGYQPSIFRPVVRSATNYDISLVANAYPNVLQYDSSHYRQKSLELLLNPLLEQHQRVDLWGNHWDKMQPYLTYAIPTSWQHGPIHYLKTNDIYNNSNIILCLQNYKEDVITMRTYEILGSGGFMLTSSHSELQRYFNPGKDFIMIDSKDSTMAYIRYYLKHPHKRNKFQKCAEKAVSEHSYLTRSLEMIKKLKKDHILPHHL
jgi:spore maturation protein CgeB